MKYNFGIVKEIKEGETRVAITPDVVAMLNADGLNVIIETNAGEKSGFSDEEYLQKGATIASSAQEVWENSKIILKVKEPQKTEYQYFRRDLIIFSYLHLDLEKELTKELLAKKVCAISSECVETQGGHLPLLTPMSEVAGRLSLQLGAQLLQTQNGGSGVLLSGAPGVDRGKVAIIGAGVVGLNAARTALGIGADVSIFDINPDKLSEIEKICGNAIKTHYCNPAVLTTEVPKADLLITSVLMQSGEYPKIITEDMVKNMKKGSVIIDVTIDQGGVVETIDKPTTLEKPTYEKFGVLHCAIPNIPSATPRTSSYAYSYATYPYLKKLGELGLTEAIKENYALSKGISAFNGELTNEKAAKALDLDYTQIEFLVGFKLK